MFMNYGLRICSGLAVLALVSCGAKNTSNNLTPGEKIETADLGTNLLSEAQSAQVVNNVSCKANNGSDCSLTAGFQLAPVQQKFSRFDVKYEVSCGEAGFLSPLAVKSDQQLRAFVYASNTTVSVFGMGPVVLTHRRVPESNVSTLSTGCRLSAEVVAITSVDSLAGGIPGSALAE
jgi:hypothetical protein